MGLLLAIGLQRPARAELILERTLAAPSPMSGAQFGSDVAFSGSEGIVGAPAGGSLPGAAFAFQGDPLTSLTHAPQPGDEAGFAVAAAGDDVVVGVPGVRVDAGTAYVYDASGNFLTELLRPATAAGDHFGFAVAVSANRIVVGAPGASTNGQADAGAVYLFDGDRSSPTFGHPLATAMLAKPGGAVAGDEFGAAVAVGESSIFVGAPFDGGTGAVYVFDLNGHYTGHMLQGEMPAAGDLFGAAVAAYQGGVLVGAPLEDRPAVDAGAAYFFDATFQMQRRFTGDPSDPGDEFGASVAGFGTRVVIGAPLADRTFVDQGVVQIFDPTLGDQTLVSPTPSTDGRFGAAVATGDTRVVIGAPHEVGQEGRAHVFTPSLCVTPEGGPVICNDNNACTTEACNGLTGKCEVTGTLNCGTNGCPCCVFGTCDPVVGCVFTPGPPCNDNNACTTDTCDCSKEPGLGCIYTPIPPCNDNNKCTIDTCDPTFGCVFTPIPPCNDGNDCTVDTCDPASGCVFTPIPSCSPLTGHSEITSTSPCALDCDDGDPCTIDECDPVTLQCVSTRAPEAECDDGNLVCGDGCDPPATPGSHECRISGCGNGIVCPLTGEECDDGNTVSGDGCEADCRLPTSAGTAQVRAQGLESLQPLDACMPTTTTTTIASTSSTTSTTTIPAGCTNDSDCDDRNECTHDKCLPQCDGCFLVPWTCCARKCVHTNVADGTACDDRNPCNLAETCQKGTCTPGSMLTCDDSDVCTTDICDPACVAEMTCPCRHPHISGCTPCDTTTPCPTEECRTVTCATPCPDNRGQAGGCCTYVNVLDGTACGNDSNPCNGKETCQAGECTAGRPPACERACVHQPPDVYATTGCDLRVALDEVGCAVPAPVEKRVARAIDTLAVTGTRKSAKGKRHTLGQAVTDLERATKAIDRLAHKTRLDPDCASRLRQTLDDARGHVEGLLAGLKH